MAKLLALSLLLAVTAARAADDDIWSLLSKCSSADELSSCLQLKLAASLEAASAARSLQLGPLTLTRDPSLPSRVARSEKQLEDALPRSMDKDQALTDLVFDKASNLLQTHSIKLNMDQLAPKEEGRGKRRRTLAALLLMFMMSAGTLIPIKLGTLALLAGKALIISKLALALALIIGLKKILSSHDDHEPSYQVVHGHRRELNAHDLAYNAYAK